MSLQIPEHYLNFNLVSIDPGLNNFGVAIFNINYSTKAINSIQTVGVKTDKIFDYTGLDNELHGDRLVKLVKIKERLLEILTEHNPCVVACEAPFYNPLMPNAYRALVEAIMSMQTAVLEHNSNVPFIQVSPREVKQAVNANATKGKIVVKDGVSQIQVLTDAMVDNIDDITEHCVDAIAVGYCFLKLSEGLK